MEQDRERTYHWITAVVASAFVLLVAMGGAFALRDRLLADTRSELTKQDEARDKLAARLDALESAIAELKNGPAADTKVVDDKLTGINEQLDTLTKRIDALEKKPEEKKQDTSSAALSSVRGEDSAARLKLAALSGKSFAGELTDWLKSHPDQAPMVDTLRMFASGGIPSEAELARELAALLGTRAEAKKVEDESTVGKINTHLKGLVTIKKASTEDTYSDLRKEVLTEDLATLERHVERLPETDRAALLDWQKHVRDRRAALDALDSLAGAH